MTTTTIPQKRENPPNLGKIFLMMILLLGALGLLILKSVGGGGGFYNPHPQSDEEWDEQLCQMYRQSVNVAEFTILPHFVGNSLEMVVVEAAGLDSSAVSFTMYLEEPGPEVRYAANKEGITLPERVWKGNVFNLSSKQQEGIATRMMKAANEYVKNNSPIQWREFNNARNLPWKTYKNCHNMKAEFFNPKLEYPTFWIGTFK